MRKQLMMLLILILSIATFVGCNNGYEEVNISDKESFEVFEYEEIPDISDNYSDVQGLYTDPSESINKMKTTTENILYGEVISVEEVSSLAVRVSVRIIDSYKGKLNVDDIINITQIGTPESDEVLNVGDKYILFVNSNKDIENSYYIRAGVEGIFNISEDNEFISSELEKWNIDLSKTFKLKNDGETKVKFNDFVKYLKLN